MTKYFSEQEVGAPPRDTQEITERAWRGILAEVRRCVSTGAFGAHYPEVCPDGTYIFGTHLQDFEDAMLAEVPGISGYAEQDSVLEYMHVFRRKPSDYDILDLVQFCWGSVAKPRRIKNHNFHSHYDLAFDEDAGKQEFAEKIETIFRRNGIAYRLLEEGRIERVIPLAFQKVVSRRDFNTGDDELDRLLTAAQRKFLDYHPDSRQEALEALWDAWERLKTLDGQGDKKATTKLMLDTTAGEQSPQFRDALEREADELRTVGNSLRIRHSETTQEALAWPEHADYLFYRLFSLTRLVLAARSRT